MISIFYTLSSLGQPSDNQQISASHIIIDRLTLSDIMRYPKCLRAALQQYLLSVQILLNFQRQILYRFAFYISVLLALRRVIYNNFTPSSFSMLSPTQLFDIFRCIYSSFLNHQVCSLFTWPLRLLVLLTSDLVIGTGLVASFFGFQCIY